MEQVIGVSWPRSGHHMLARLLELYFGPGFVHCEFYSPHIDCCRQFPCTRQDRVHFTKNHDWDLALPQLPNRKYLVQVRDFLPSVVSNFDLNVRNGNPDGPDHFRQFASVEFGRYRAFMDKWVRSDFARRQLVVNYGDLLRDPPGELARVVAYFDPAAEADAERVARAIADVASEKITPEGVTREKGAGVHQERDVTRFRHYDADLFATLGALHLSRDEVKAAFRKLLDRDPREAAMLRHQTQPSVEKLERSIRSSPEYRMKHGAIRAFADRLLGRA
jgi:hypothetical protein